ncbi:hypothetical protein NA57DRAFT_78710 [Rhizodiscina lignyota]|uniref:EthD domain-containing protein n=1 Tax=Rhizodiscina lignyota TaxID=1504668 RepID=A0A9P4M2R2_9PEZI|nr:hypothetical protein NA57DRAFT_78710 [Rhizodiscina lignyota]
MSSQSVIRLSMYFKRNPKLSEEEFHKYWTEDHAPLVSEWLAGHGVLRYVQNHFPPSTRAMAEGVKELPLADLLLPFDGVADFWMYKLEDFLNATKDPYYKEKVAADEDYLFDRTATRMTIGKEVVVIENGKVLQDKFVWAG